MVSLAAATTRADEVVPPVFTDLPNIIFGKNDDSGGVIFSNVKIEIFDSP